MGNGDYPARQKQYLEHDEQRGFDDIVPCPGIGPRLWDKIENIFSFPC